jgi:hypothetical protein
MSIALPHTRRQGPPSGLGRTVAQARAQAVENRRPARRVRHEVRDGVAVVAFSAVSSTGLAGLITVIVSMAR